MVDIHGFANEQRTGEVITRPVNPDSRSFPKNMVNNCRDIFQDIRDQLILFGLGNKCRPLSEKIIAAQTQVHKFCIRVFLQRSGNLLQPLGRIDVFRRFTTHSDTGHGICIAVVDENLLQGRARGHTPAVTDDQDTCGLQRHCGHQQAYKNCGDPQKFEHNWFSRIERC